MTRISIPILISILSISLAACGSSGESQETSKPAPERPATTEVAPTVMGDVLPASKRAFTEIAPFVKMAASHGDRASGAHGTFGIFRAGASSPPHTHTGAYHGVVISGTMTNPFGSEAKPPELGPGSYWYVPAGAEHVTSCISKEPCEFYFHAKDGFDFAPLEAMTGPRPAEARTLGNTELGWAEIAPFVSMAGAFGDRAAGGHGTFGLFKANASSPAHTHSGAYRAIVIKGTMTNPFGDQSDAPELAPGSSWHVPAGAPHRTTCVSSEPCLFYFHADSKFDFTPVKGAE